MAIEDINTLPRELARALNPFIGEDASVTMQNVITGISVIQDIDMDNEGMREATNTGMYFHSNALQAALKYEATHFSKPIVA